MELDEAIKFCEDVAETNKGIAENYKKVRPYEDGWDFWEKESKTFYEIADLLKELKTYKEHSGDAISRNEVLYLMADHDLSMGQVVKAIHALPPVMPKEKIKVLDKIRGEIEQLPTNTRINWDGCCPDPDYPEIEFVDVSKKALLGIIDKYRVDKEE